MIELSTLPTHVAQVARRLNIVGEEASADTFLITSYLAEAAIKTIAIAFHSGLSGRAPDHAYRIGYELVRADGLGTWETVIRDSTTQPIVSFLPPNMNSLITWATKLRTKPEDEWFQQAKRDIEIVFRELGIESGIPERKPTARDLIAALVQVRNKTKAHGAVGVNFFSAANQPYSNAVKLLLTHCPVFQWQWLYLFLSKAQPQGVLLVGDSPYRVNERVVASLNITKAGVYFRPDTNGDSLFCSDLLRSDRECNNFLFPNGGYSPTGEAWFINYGTGVTSKEDVSLFSLPPAPLPPSETHGLDALDVQSNVFGNLPQLPDGYVRRKVLEEELELRLRDKNHSIITLHGRGGIGKTSLALKVAHKLAAEVDPLFEHIVWFSARDVDLRATGPSSVRPSVINLEMVSKKYRSLFGVGGKLEDFAEVLRSPETHSNKGILFIFDNFETMADVRELHQFLDTHTHLPNKVLITSRERAFKADFPIEVKGMEYGEAVEMLTRLARELSIEGLVTEGVIKNIFDYSEGHPYVMRILIGEISKERRFVPAKSLLPKRLDIVSAVFERSFNKLSEAGKRVFLTVASWKSAVSELALIVIVGQRNLDVEEGIEECTRLSLLSRIDYLDGQPAYIAPQVARVFAQKKLEGDPDRLVIQEDLAIMQQFGVLPTSQQIQIPQEESIRRFINWCMSQSNAADKDKLSQIDATLEILAGLWPEAWINVAAFRQQHNFGREQIEYALRRSVEENPSIKEAWMQRAAYARGVEDRANFISSRIRVVELDPSDVILVREVALELCQYVVDRAAEIPITRRGVYLASVRQHMVNISDKLDATGLSRLAWLYLLEGNKPEAWRYASQGLRTDQNNEHCFNIINRLRKEGFMPRAR